MSKNFLQKAAIVISSILVTLIIMEVGIRLTGLWVKDSYDNRDYFAETGIPGVPYRLKPNIHAKWAKTNIIANSEGIRARREYDDKKKGVFRILAIGDSITFGMGVDQDDAYPRQLEKLLNRYTNTAIEYEVINGGMSGFNASDEAHFMAYLSEKYRPDLIIWMLIANDYDDSLGVNENGKMTSNIPTYAATNSWLEQTWGLTGPYISPSDFLESMEKRKQCWALGEPMPRKGGIEKIDTYLHQHSYLYGFVYNRVKGVLQDRRLDPIPGDRDLLVRKPLVRLKDGSVDAIPEINSIFMSPYYKKRFYKAIEKGIRVAEDSRIPLVILSFNVHLETYYIQNKDKIGIQDIGQYLAMPVSRFRQRYNLGWDPHFNSNGNERLAHGVMHVLMDNGLFASAHDEESVFFDRTLYWKRYKRDLTTYADRLGTFIDFKHFKNIHQLVGGMYPPRMFPIKGNAKLSVILRNPDTTRFRIAGHNGNPPQAVVVWLSDGNLNVATHITIPAGVFDLTIEIPDSTSFKGKVLDAHLYCRTGNCREMKINYLGFHN